MSLEPERVEVLTEGGVPTLGQWARFLRRNLLLIGGCAVGLGVLVAVVLLFALPKRYEATGTILVTPGTLPSTLTPEPFSIQGYQRLLESDAVVRRAGRALVEEGILAEHELPGLRESLGSRIFVARRQEQTELAPVIEVFAHADDGEKAAALANAWIQAFVEVSQDFVGARVDQTVELVELQYAEKRDQVAELEARRRERSDAHQTRLHDAMSRWDERIDEIQTRWDREILAEGERIQASVSEHQLESRGLIEAAVGGADLDPTTPLAAAFGRIVSLRIQLAQTPPYRSVERAISDEALWQVMAMGEAATVDIEPFLERTLQSREPVPLYDELALRVAAAEADLDELLASADGRGRVAELRQTVESIQRQRGAQLAALVEAGIVTRQALRRGRLIEVAGASRQRQYEVDSINRLRDTELGALERELRPREAQFDKLADTYEEAMLAHAQRSEAVVRVGTRAVPVLSPQSTSVLFGALAALLLGASIGLLVALGRGSDGG